MTRLSASERAKLPDRAFAYVDSAGKRRLPIHDASHVRSALSRFDQVGFESDAARDRARQRLLGAAKRFRIVPVGFIDRQLRQARGDERPDLPGGFVTMLMSDIEGSTEHLAELGDRYGDILDQVRDVHRQAVGAAGGTIVEARADEFFAVFGNPLDAVRAGVDVHRRLAALERPGERPVEVRIGVHAGYPTKRGDNYIGMAVHVLARVSDAAHGGQLVVTDDLKLALTGADCSELRFRRLGTHRLRGIPEPVTVHQVLGDGLRARFPALRC